MRGAAGTLRSGRVSVFPRRRFASVLVGVLVGGARVVGNGTDESANSGRAYTGCAPGITLDYSNGVCSTRRRIRTSGEIGCYFLIAGSCKYAESWQQGTEGRWERVVGVVMARARRRPAAGRQKVKERVESSKRLEMFAMNFSALCLIGPSTTTFNFQPRFPTTKHTSG